MLAWQTGLAPANGTDLPVAAPSAARTAALNDEIVIVAWTGAGPMLTCPQGSICR